VEESEEGDEGVTRRYLLQDSKINSTVKIGICMRQVDGERNFVAPPLKTAAVFGGIAGIMAGEREGEESVGRTSSFFSHISTSLSHCVFICSEMLLGERTNISKIDLPNLNKTRDHSELHDIYRRSLAASWAAQAGELPADQCVEDIFNGGSGFKAHSPGPLSPHDLPPNMHTSHHHHTRQHSNASDKSASTIRKPSRIHMGHKRDGSREGGLQKEGSESSLNESLDGGERGRTGLRRASEVDEFEVREDLIAWRLPGLVR